jgi:hypothetical protein
LSTGVSAVAVLLVALGYAESRWGGNVAILLFWSGQLVLLVAAAAVLLAPRPGSGALTTAVLVYSAGQSMMRWSYSPLRLEFGDELQHQRSAVEILQSGHLFPVNYSLPISASYPGLEAVADGLRHLTGLSLYVSAVLTAGLAHVLGAAAVLLFLRRFGKPRAAALAALVYAVGSYATFSTLFVYQTLALPVAVLVVAEVLAFDRARGRSGRAALVFLLSALVVVTHHLTSFVLLAALLVVGLVQVTSSTSRSAAKWTFAAAFVLAAVLATWTATVARAVIPYLVAPLEKLADSLRGARSGSYAAPPGAGQPLIERTFTLGAVLLLIVGLALAAWMAWRRRQRGIAAFTAAALGIQVMLVVIRLVASDGAELASRALAFTALVTAAAFASVVTAATDGWFAPPPRHRSPAASATADSRLRRAVAACLVVLAVGGTAGGWPPHYERLPTYQVGSFESAMDKHTIEASNWVGSALKPGNRFGADFGNLVALGTIGNQVPVVGSYAKVFTKPTDRSAVVRAVRKNGLMFLLVDNRITEQLPPPDRGTWFWDADPRAGTYTEPVAPGLLTSLDRLLATDRIFDDGLIRIYDLRESPYVHP